MKIKILQYYTFIFLVLLMIISCDPRSERSVSNGKKDGPVKLYHSDGSVRSIINFKNGKRHGVAKSYYKDGKLRQEIQYVNNVKHGEVITYYENGKKYQVTPYVNGKIEGIRKKYRMNGQLMAEIPYQNGQACAGLKEYLLDGNIKTQYPEIVVKEIDHLLKSNEFILRIYMSDKSKEVVYYLGDIDKNGCIKEDAMRIEPQQPGILELKFSLGPGMFMMEEYNIIAVAETRLGNPYITQRKYNLAIENRG